MSKKKAAAPALERTGYCVYRLISKRTGRIYVGATCDLKQRMRKRFRYQSKDDAHFGAAADWWLDVLSVHEDGADAAEAEVKEQLAIPRRLRVNRIISSNIPAGPPRRSRVLPPGEHSLEALVDLRRIAATAERLGEAL